MSTGRANADGTSAGRGRARRRDECWDRDEQTGTSIADYRITGGRKKRRTWRETRETEDTEDTEDTEETEETEETKRCIARIECK